MYKIPGGGHPRRSESVLWLTKWLCYTTETTTSVSHDAEGTCRGDLHPVPEFRDNLNQGRSDNRDLRAQADHIIKFDHVVRTHSHATVTDRHSQVSFFRRSVNVDIAAESIRVLRLSPTQPNNAGDDRVAPGSIG